MDSPRVVQIITQPYATVDPSVIRDLVAPFFQSICNHILYHLVLHFISSDRRGPNIQPSCKFELGELKGPNGLVHTPFRKGTKRETKRNASAFTTLDMTATPTCQGDYRGSSSVDPTDLQNPLNIVSIRFSTRILRVQSSVLGVQGAVELEALKDEEPDSYNRCYFREVFANLVLYILLHQT